jgi:hypothetical protein
MPRPSAQQEVMLSPLSGVHLLRLSCASLGHLLATTTLLFKYLFCLLLFCNKNVGASGAGQSIQKCATCQTAAHVQPVNLPYVFRYLANELAGMGIKMSLKLSE